MSSISFLQPYTTGSVCSSFWRTSDADRPPLRIGLLLDGTTLSAFFARIVEDITESNFATLELLVLRKAASLPEQHSLAQSPLQKLARRLFDPRTRKHALYDLYLRCDKRMKPAPDPLAKVDCSPLLMGIESIEVEPIGKNFVHRFPTVALEKIRSKDLDVLLRFGFNILHGEILSVARYGVWSYHHGDSEYYRGGPAHFWELYEGADLSGVVLQVLTEELDGGLVLCKSLFATERTISVSKNRFAPYWGSTDFVIRKLNELHRFGWDYLRDRAVPPTAYKGRRKIYRAPGNTDMVSWLGPVLLKKTLHYPFRRKTAQHWRIAIRMNSERLFDPGSRGNLAGFRWIEPPRGHFWADPFAIQNGEKNYLFFEDYSYSASLGRISCAEISPEGDLLTPKVCLESAGHHYSYPHVFRNGADIFMVPESADSNSVDLYRCETFPDQWVREARLLSGRFVDSTIWRYEDLWWLMTTSAEPDARAGCLLLFYSESLTGRWCFHPANPISTDVRNNRGAGSIFWAANQLIRPSQSSCPIYGYSFWLNDITELSKSRYTERPIKVITPVWQGVRGVHTYNWIRNVEIIDGQSTKNLAAVSSTETSV